MFRHSVAVQLGPSSAPMSDHVNLLNICAPFGLHTGLMERMAGGALHTLE